MTTEPATTADDGAEPVTGELMPWEPSPRTLVRYIEQPRDLVDGWTAHAASVFRLAEEIAPTDFVPKLMRNNPAAVAACILSGRELGVGPMTALRHVQMVEGSPSLSAEYKRARVLSKGHTLDVIELNTTRCTIRARRKGGESREFTYTLDDAKRANLIKPRGAWETRPRRMLFARVTSEACDFMFSDLVNGLPTTELLEEGEYADLDDVAAPGTETEPRKAQRRTPAGTRQQRAGSPERDRAPAPEPPLPGEEPDPSASMSTDAAPAGGGEDIAKGGRRARGQTAKSAFDPSEMIPVGPEHASGARTTPDDAPATAEPSEPAAPDGAPDEEVRDPAAMVKKIQTMFGTAFGIKGRHDKLRVVAALAGRIVGSSSELTFDECIAVIDGMEMAAQAPMESERAKRLWVIVNAWEDSRRRPSEQDEPVEEEPI